MSRRCPLLADSGRSAGRRRAANANVRFRPKADISGYETDMRHIIRVGSGISAFALVVTWLLLADSSPAREWLLAHPGASNVARAANLPAFVAAAVGSGNPHAPSTLWIVIAMTGQWLLVGLLLAGAYFKVMHPRMSASGR